MNKNIVFTIEFEQFVSRLKTDQDFVEKSLIDNELLIAFLLSVTARFFYICDDRQFYAMKSYLQELYSKDFMNGDELYRLGVSQEILDIVYRSFNDNERDATLNMFGKGNIFPFNKAPCILFGKSAYGEKSKAFCTYKFVMKVKEGQVYYKYKMPFFMNPTKVFTPLMMGFVIEYVYMNIKDSNVVQHSKKIMSDMLNCINSRRFSEFNLVNGILSKNGLSLN